jgi:salicylate hydroxylase
MWVLCDREPVALVAGPRHAARRRGAPDAAVLGAGRLHGDRRRGHPWRALRATPHDIAEAFRIYQKARYLRTGRVQLTARIYGEIYHASGVMRELRNRMFQSGSETAGFIGTHWLYQGIDPDRPFD